MQVEIVGFRLRFLRDNLNLTVLGMRVGDTRLLGVAHAVRQQYLVAARIAQYPHAVRGFFLVEAMAC